MALSKEQYQAFEAIVGPENISDDPVDLDAWAWRSGRRALAQDFKPRFEAILMPGSTEEVQAIVRLCNRLGVQFKASSTGWGVYCDAGGPGCIKLDMRRMNRIIEINEENMYAVVEPYVIHAQLQAELMKRGFCCNVNGAGGITSAHAPGCPRGHRPHERHLQHQRAEPAGSRVGHPRGRDHPDRLAGGPGRVVLRRRPRPLPARRHPRQRGAAGRTGRLHQGGAQDLPLGRPADHGGQGLLARLRRGRTPANFLLRYLSWPDRGRPRRPASGSSGRARSPSASWASTPTWWRRTSRPATRRNSSSPSSTRRRSSAQASASSSSGNSPRDFEYKKAVLEQIIKDTRRDLAQGGRRGRRARLASSGASSGSPLPSARPCGPRGCSAARSSAPTPTGSCRNFIQHSRVDKKDLIDRGLVYPDNVDPFITSLEQGQLTHSEVLLRWTPAPDVADGRHGVRGQGERERGGRPLRPAAPPVQRHPARFLRAAHHRTTPTGCGGSRRASTPTACRRRATT